jgi:hypothetical protein
MDCDDADYWTHVVTVKFNDCMVTAGLFFVLSSTMLSQ